MEPAGISLKLIVIKTRNVQEVAAFYQTLGVPLSEERHGKGPLHYAGQMGQVVFEVYPLLDPSCVPDTTTRLGFAVDNLERVLELLCSAGTPTVSPAQDTSWGFRAVVRDPDGRVIELYQR